MGDVDFFRIARKTYEVQRLIDEHQYWVYKLENDIRVDRSRLGKDYTPRKGWTLTDCMEIVSKTPYPTTEAEMRAAIEQAKNKEKLDSPDSTK